MNEAAVGRLLDASVSYHPAPDGAQAALGLAALLAALERSSGAGASLPEHSGVCRATLAEPNKFIAAAEKLALLRNVAAAYPPGAVLQVCSRMRVTDFGMLGFVLASSATVGEALDFAVRQQRLLGPMLAVALDLGPDSSALLGADVLGLGAALPAAIEFWLGSMLALLRQIHCGPVPSRSLRLPIPEPAEAHVYRALFGCPVQFGADLLVWEFDSGMLAAPCPDANATTALLCREHCARIAAPALNTRTPFSLEVRQVVAGSHAGFPSAEEVAQRLAISVRTLHRRLAREAAGYRDIVDEIRRPIAIDYLERTCLCVDEIAMRLGFSEAANFRKAFKKWTGYPPSHFRRAQNFPR